MKIEIGENLTITILGIFFFILLAIIIIVSPKPAHSQTVELLTPDEVQTAERLNLEQIRLNTEWANLRNEIIRTHLEAAPPQMKGCVVNQMLIKPEWGCAEFVYSTNFRAIIPAKVLTLTPYGANLYQIGEDGQIQFITEKPVLEEDENGYHWVWNNYHNSENNPSDIHKYKEPQN